MTYRHGHPETQAGRRVVFYRGPREKTVRLDDQSISVQFDELAMQIATHEAGHAVIGLVFDTQLARVEIFPDEARGLCHSVLPATPSERGSNVAAFDKVCEGLYNVDLSTEDRRLLNVEMVVLAAGFAAQQLYSPHAPVTCARSDYHKMEQISRLLTNGSRQVASDLVKRQKARAAELVEQNRSAIAAVAAELYCAHVLDGDEVREIVRRNS